MTIATVPDTVRGKHASIVDQAQDALTISGELRLIAAVITTALEDAKRGNLEAAAWIGSSAALRWIDHLTPGQLEPENVQNALIDASGMPCKELVMELPIEPETTPEPPKQRNECMVCGKGFESRRRDALTCSQACRSRRTRIKSVAGV